MAKPLVSICIPNYNNARYLDGCIQSALRQTYPHTEIVLTDDASTDESMDIAAQYREQLRVLRNATNLGQPKNTNACIAASRGEYVVVLHSDDALLPEFAERLVPHLERCSRVGMAVGERLETDESGVTREIAPFYKRDCIVPGERQAKVFMMTSFLPCQVLVRRSTLDAVGGVDERHIVNLDGLLWFKCALQGDVSYTQAPVCIYRRHGESTTATYNRTISHMMEYHTTLSAMFKLAATRPNLAKHIEASERRLGALTVRYCHDVIKEGNYALAKRYLALAPAFDAGITRSQEYRTLKYCVESEDIEPRELYFRLVDRGHAVRTTSYEPPEGSVPLEL